MRNLGLLTANASRRGSDATTDSKAQTNYQQGVAQGSRFCCDQNSTHTQGMAELHLLLQPEALNTEVCLSLYNS
jgi:hypothetical protein